MTISKCRFCLEEDIGLGLDPGDFAKLEAILPDEYQHQLCSHDLAGESFKCVLRLAGFSTQNDVEKWLVAFQTSSYLTWKKSKTYPGSGRFNNYRVDLRCHHNTRYTKKSQEKKREGKNTLCPATLYLVLKRSVKYSRSQDPHYKNGLMFYIRLNNDHNHQTTCADAQIHRVVSEDTITKMNDLFQHGHSASSALETLKYDLQEEHGDQFTYVSADRSVCPDIQFCFRLYYKTFKKGYGASSGKETFVDLEKRLQAYNEETQEISATIGYTEDKQTLIAICTPLMKKVHTQVKESGEIMFVDSGNCDRHKSRIFIFLTHSSAGRLPLGVLITTSESQHTITAGINLLKTILPDGSFFGRDVHGPEIVMTYDCLALRQAIHSVYPGTNLLLCISHVLQSMWCWLWDNHNGIQKPDRSYLLGILKDMVYAKTTRELDSLYQAVFKDRTTLKHKKYIENLSSVFERKEAWAICYRSTVITSDNSTSNVVESAMAVVKDKLLHRLRPYNITQLVDFLFTRMDSFYTRRLVDVSNNCIPNIHQSQYIMSASDRPINNEEIVKEDETNYSVPAVSSGLFHYINMEIGICTCPAGSTGGPCKHQHAVKQKFNISNTNFFPTTSPGVKTVHYPIATGIDNIQTEWICNLGRENEVIPAQDDNMRHTTIDVPSQQDAEIRGLEFEISTVHENDAENDDIQDRLNRMFTCLSTKLKEDGDSFRPHLKRFVSNFEEIQTDSALMSALSTFNGPKNKPKRKRYLQSTTAI